MLLYLDIEVILIFWMVNNQRDPRISFDKTAVMKWRPGGSGP